MHAVNPTVYRWRWLWFVLWLMMLAGAGWEMAAEEMRWWPFEPGFALDALLGTGNGFFDWTGLHNVFGYELVSGGIAGRPFNVVYVVAALLTALVFTLCLWAFTYSPRSAKHLPARRPMSALQRVVAAFMVGVLVAAAVWLILDELNLWRKIYPLFPSSWYSQPQLSNVRWQFYGVPDLWWAGPLLLAIGFACGLVWFFFFQGETDERYWKLERLTRRFTLAALLVWLWVAVHAWFGEAEDIYEDGYTAGVLCAFVLLWSFGVRALLLLQLRRYEVARDDTDEPVCFACGYDLRGTVGTSATACPECGAPVAVKRVEQLA